MRPAPDANLDLLPSPRWGPGFLNIDALPYRLEMAAATLLLLAIIVGAPTLSVGGIDILQTVFWLLWPDLLAFIPIGLANKGSRQWPVWGPWIYNTGHSLLTWGAVIVLWSSLTGALQWPLLGWAAHITADRALGFYLRAPARSPEAGKPSP